MDDDRKNYRETINLPRTGFPMKAGLPSREPQILRAWEESALPRQVLGKGRGEPFILHDGPPYANGHIHIGTAYNKVLKDMVVRARRREGRPAPFRPGWDCHGMPIEQQVAGRRDKNTLDRSALRREAAAYARRFVDIQREEFRRLGVFAAWEDPYLTLLPDYEAREVLVFGRLAEDGYISRGERPVHWCCRCETALAEAEIEYAEHDSNSIFVLFPLAADPSGVLAGADRVFFAVWTTTPWTLPANQALLVNPGVDYRLVEAEGGRRLLVAAGRVAGLPAGAGASPASGPLLPGRRLVGLSARHPLDGRVVPVLPADFVSLEEGTGIVHCAPGHGPEDYQVGRSHGLPVSAPIDARGCFTDAVPAWRGVPAWEADPGIVETLSSRGLLLEASRISHSYPHCWRCHRPVLFRATPQWFLNLDHRGLRARVVAEAEKTEFYPEESRNRFVSTLLNRPDWCLSRQRLWGVPVPVFFCRACREPQMDGRVFRAIAEVFRQEGSDSWFREPPARFLPDGYACACGGREFEPENDILDVWFDSGVSWAGVLEPREGHFPADLYLEGSDQHRGWFQSSLITSVAVTGRAPYRRVLTHGFIVDENGRKMSKSLGNVVKPEEVIKRYGADILRLWAAGQDGRGDIQAGPALLEQVAGRYRDTRNAIRFMLGNLAGFEPGRDAPPFREMLFVDRCLVGEAARLEARVTEMYRRGVFYQAAAHLYDFVNQPLSSFYLDILKDRLYTRAADSPERRSAQAALYLICRSLLGLLAPVLCFTAEEAWGYLPRAEGDPGSVHLLEQEPLPDPSGGPEGIFDWKLFADLRRVVTREIENLRAAGQVGSSLDAALEIRAGGEAGDLLSAFGAGLPEIFIVSEVDFRRFPESGAEAPLEVRAFPCPRPRCPRCWTRRPGIGADPGLPDICPVCVEALRAREKAG